MTKKIKDFYNDMALDTVLKSEDIHPSKLRIIKNLVLLSISWWMLFSAYDGLVMLQSTLNSDRGVGVISVSIQYGCGCLSALLLPKYFIRKFGCRKVIVACIASHAPFIAANFYPHWILMIPSSILLGAANPLLWAALCAYLNNLSTLYSAHIQKTSDKTILCSGNAESQQECKCNSAYTCFGHTFLGRQNESATCASITESLGETDHFNKNVLNKSKRNQTYNASKVLEETTARFFGIHGIIYNSNIITSNITSYYILHIGKVDEGNVTNATCNCGADFCNDQVACFASNLKPPNDTARYILMAVFVGLVVLSLVIVFLFLDNLGRKNEAVSLSLELMMATCKLMKRSNMLLLIPITLYLGIGHGFFFGDFTQAYVGCTWGIHHVGLVNATFGLTLALSSISSGWLMKYVGRPPIFLLAATLNVATIAILFFWRPDAERPAMLFVVGAFFGIIIGSYWIQLRAFLGTIFKEDEEAAFGNYQLWHSVGVCMSFGYSKYICTTVKIYILIAVSTFGILGYLFVERSYSRNKKLNK